MTTISPDSLPELLRNWEIPSILSIQCLQDKTVFKVVTSETEYVLKDGTKWPSERYEFINDVLDFLSRSAFLFKVPVFIRSKVGRIAVESGERRFILSRFIEGSDHPQRLDDDGELFDESSRAIAELHTALAAYNDDQLRERTWREDVLEDLQIQLTNLTGLTYHQRVAINALVNQRGELWSSALLELPEQLIHRDCHPGNLLVEGLTITGFIDFDLLCIGSPIYDLAYYAMDLRWMTPLSEGDEAWLGHLSRITDGYRKVRSVSNKELRSFPYMMMSLHLMFVHSYMSRQENEEADSHLKALLWLHSNLDRVDQAITSS